VLDRFMDNYSTWDATNQFNFAVIVVGMGFLLTILGGLWFAHLWKLFWHYTSVRKVGWPGQGMVPVANVADDNRITHTVEAVRLTHSKPAEKKTLTVEEDNGHAEDGERRHAKPALR